MNKKTKKYMKVLFKYMKVLFKKFFNTRNNLKNIKKQCIKKYEY